VADTPRSTELRNPPPSPIPPSTWEEPGADPPRTGPGEANPFRRRFARVTLGFLVGGLALGTAGCLLGACMPYKRPAAVAMSVLWWGIYLYCFGASLGALLALFTEPTPLWPPRGPGGAGEPPSAADLDSIARTFLEPIPVRSDRLRKRTTGDDLL
jgi:hypothetical protein